MTESLFQPPDAIDPSALRRVLVIKLRNLGDVLLASPAISVLKQRLPHVEVDALVYADTADMLRGHPDLAMLHEVRRDWKRLPFLQRLGRERMLLAALRARGYDLIINLTDHVRGTRLVRMLRPRFSLAPEAPRSWLYRSAYTHFYPVIGGNRRHTVEIHLDALRRIGIHPEDVSRRLTFVTGAEAETAVEGTLRRAGLAAGSFAVIHPGSRWFFKCWPPQRVAGLGKRIAEMGLPVVLVCGPDPLEQHLLDLVSKTREFATATFAGTLSLKELGALIARARIMVGMDSAPMHIAAAMGTPTVAFFGPSGDVEWGPWQVPHRILRSSHTCRPCGRDGCGGGKRSECLEAIDIDAAFAAVKSLLEETG